MKRMMFVGCVMVAGLIGGCESTQCVDDKDCQTTMKCTDGKACTAEQMAECKERGSCDESAAKCDTKGDCCGTCGGEAKEECCGTCGGEEAHGHDHKKMACGPDCTKPCCAG